MRTLIYWGLFAAGCLCLVGSIPTLLSTVETKPTRVDALRYRKDPVEERWLDLKDAHFLWSHSVASYKTKDGKPVADAISSRKTIYYVPIVAMVDAAFVGKELKPDRVVAIARITGDVAAKQFDIISALVFRKLQVDACIGLRKPYTSLPAKIRPMFPKKIPGFEGADVIVIGAAPFQRSEARRMLTVGAVLLVIWWIWRKKRKGLPVLPNGPRNRYFVAMFSMLGKMAKADGRVSREEIAAVETFMEANAMDAASRKRGIEFFNRAKDDSKSIEDYARQVASLEPNAEVRAQVFGVLFAVATADGHLDPAERALLERLVGPLALPPDTFEKIRHRFEGDVRPLKQCYETLGCEESASDDAVKQAYREKMRTFHPDKIQAKDLPDEFLEYAKQQTQELQAAYETVMKVRRAKP